MKAHTILMLQHLVSFLVGYTVVEPIYSSTMNFLTGEDLRQDLAEINLEYLINDLAKQDMSEADKTHRILLISGHGGEVSGSKEVLAQVKALQKHGAEVTVVGTGRTDVTKKKIFEAAHSMRDDQRPLTVILLGHGAPEHAGSNIFNTESSGHVVTLNNPGFFGLKGESINTCELIKELDAELSASGANVSFFLESCFSGGVLECGRNVGADIVTLAPSDQGFWRIQLMNFISALDSTKEMQDLSAAKLLELYLMNNPFSLNLATPSMSFRGSIKNPSQRLDKMVGVSLTEQDRKEIHNALDSIIGADELTRVLDLISSGKSFSIKMLGDYGKALLIALKIEKGEIVLKIDHGNVKPKNTPYASV